MNYFGGNISLVAQVGNLLFRRLAVGKRPANTNACGLPIRDTADCQSALQLKTQPPK